MLNDGIKPRLYRNNPKKILGLHGQRTNKTNVIKMNDKILWYVSTCWDNYRCAAKDEVKRIIQEVIADNPEISDYIKLGVLAKRRCQGEL